MTSKLPPLELETEVDEYQSFQETTEIDLQKCKHKNIRIDDNAIKCSCGMNWRGAGIARLYQAMKKR